MKRIHKQLLTVLGLRRVTRSDYKSRLYELVGVLLFVGGVVAMTAVMLKT